MLGESNTPMTGGDGEAVTADCAIALHIEKISAAKDDHRRGEIKGKPAHTPQSGEWS